MYEFYFNVFVCLFVCFAEMLVPGHVCSLYVATGGANGPALGSDEKEIVLLDYSVIDVLTNEVSSLKKANLFVLSFSFVNCIFMLNTLHDNGV